MAKIYKGYFLIADITGYTQYLSESELDHAQETLTALLQLLVDGTSPPLVISRLAGDAVISYGLLENFFYGQTFIEKIEDTYIEFRKTLERLVLNNTCRCNACANISNLDLKFFIHYGSFGIQRIDDHDELVGSDVIVIHRLLKNSVTETTGFQGYALYSEAAIKQLNVEEFIEAMIPLTETYEHLGEVNIWVQDMHPVWEAKRSSVATEFPYDQVAIRIEVIIEMPRERLWDYLIQPEYRNILTGSDRMEIANRSQGRIAPGSIYQCYHGDRLTPQTILEWQPFESMIIRELISLSPSTSILSEYRLEDIDGESGVKTRFIRTFSKPSGPIFFRTLIGIMLPVFRRMTKQTTKSFVQQIESDYRAQIENDVEEVEFSSDLIREAAAAGARASSGG